MAGHTLVGFCSYTTCYSYKKKNGIVFFFTPAF